MCHTCVRGVKFTPQKLLRRPLFIMNILLLLLVVGKVCVCACASHPTPVGEAQIWESVKCYNLIRTVSPFTVRHDQQIVKGYTQPHTHTGTRETGRGSEFARPRPFIYGWNYWHLSSIGSSSSRTGRGLSDTDRGATISYR